TCAHDAGALRPRSHTVTTTTPIVAVTTIVAVDAGVGSLSVRLNHPGESGRSICWEDGAWEDHRGTTRWN
ncbi:MAG: hypothetical protein ACYCVV_21175, partial [Acidimicrobiales bacterium]